MLLVIGTGDDNLRYHSTEALIYERTLRDK